MLREVVSKFEDGTYQTLPQHEVPISDIENGFRFMAQAKHIGKVVFTHADPNIKVSTNVVTATRFDDAATYLITGGLGGFGIAVARWMVEHNARFLALMGRAGADEETEKHLQSLRAAGAQIEIVRGDVSREADVQSVLEHIRRKMPPLKGIIHAAMVLDDAPLNQLDERRLGVVMEPKMSGAWHLHLQTLNEPLDFFVLFSSIASLLGNPLQANYAAANAFLDSLAHHRKGLGLKALTVNWGVLSGVGYVSRHAEIAGYLERQGYLSFTPEQALDTLGQLLSHDVTQAMAARIDWQTWAKYSPAAAASPRLLHFVPSQQDPDGREDTSASLSSETFISASEPIERQKQIESYLRQRVGRVLGISPAKIQFEQPLTEMGFDSLIAVELMTMLKVELGVEVPVVKLLQGVSIAGLTVLVGEQLAPSVKAVTFVPQAETVHVEATSLPAVELENPTLNDAHSTAAEAATNEIDLPAATSSNGNDAVSHDDESVASAYAETARIQPSSATNGNGTPRNKIDYSALDYSTWTPHQRLMQRVVAASFRSLTETRIEGQENIPRTGAFLLAVNHLSMFDLPLMLTFLPRPTIVYVAEEFRTPWLNWFLSDLGNAIFLRRGMGDEAALELGLTVLRAGGVLAVGPEGRISLTGALEQGNSGAAYLATQAGTPILPVVAWGQEKLVSRLTRFRRPTINVKIGAPFRLPGGTAQAWQLRDYTN